MLLLDGCFIVEFLRKFARKKKNDANPYHDPIFKMKCVSVIRRDLLLFENQIPFFILDKLFDVTNIRYNPTPAHHEEEEDTSLISLAISCLNLSIKDKSSPPCVISPSKKVFHLLGLMYESWCSSFDQTSDNEEKKGTPPVQNGNNCPPDFLCINIGRKNPKDEDLNDFRFIKSVTELNKGGIKFVESNQSRSWLDIKFEDGKIKIPLLVIKEATEVVLRNLIAYEQYMFDLGYSGKFITDYTMFMNCLINTPKDVQNLRVKGIIKHWLGSDEEITRIFNNIGDKVIVSRRKFTYRKHFKNVNKHCNERRNAWINDFNEKYFKNSWSIISLIAATFLLILTLIQIVLSFLQTF